MFILVGATRVTNPVLAREADWDANGMRTACSGNNREFECVLTGTEQAVSYEDCGYTSGGGFSEYSKRV